MSKRSPVEAALVAVLKAELPDLAEVNDVAVDIARSQAADLLAGASKTKKAVVRSLIRRALAEGWSDALLQKRIAEKAGLDPRSAQALESYRAGLKANNVPPGRMERQVEAYRKRLLKHRAAVIARSEIQQALMDAQRAIWAKQQRMGDLSPYAVRVTVTHRDERLCPTCRPQGGRRHSLRSPDGGPPFHPQCRCYEELVDEGIVKYGNTVVPDGRLIGMDDVTKKVGHRLDWSPKKNWVEEQGGLPKYIEDIALALIRDHGMDPSRAIAVAISRCKMWAKGGGDVEADTRAKAAKAMAEWEAKKARAKRDD